MQSLFRKAMRPSCLQHVTSRRSARVQAVAYATAGPYDGAGQGEGPVRHTTKYAVYKGKAALQISMIGPTWKATSKGTQYVDREGALFLEFAAVNQGAGQQSGYGERSYSWDQKVVFAMKATELGFLIDGKSAEGQGISLFHDPDKGTQNEGNQKKTLSIKLNPDGLSYMFSISQNDKSGGRANVAVPVTSNEMVVIRTLVAFAIPHLLGWNVVAETMHNYAPGSPQQV